jgi:hypothetical protein
MKFLNFFLLLWVIALLDPDADPDLDPLTRLNPDPIRIRIRNSDFKLPLFRNRAIAIGFCKKISNVNAGMASMPAQISQFAGILIG